MKILFSTKTFQALYYPNASDFNNFMLLEVDKEMVSDIENGESLIFKGGLNEKVVLCTKGKTYEVRNAEQSNSLLVVPNLLLAKDMSNEIMESPPLGEINKSLDKSLEDEENQSSQLAEEHEIQHKNILKIFFNYLECKQIKPRARKILDLLKLTMYTGPENEHLIDRKSLFTYRQLLNTIQCSVEEFDELLVRLRCFELNKHMRVLDYTYEYRVVASMIALISENSWQLDEIDQNITIEALEGIIPKEITKNIFKFYTESSTGDKFRYREDLVARIVAQNVLIDDLKFHINEFFETCQSALPEGMEMNEKYLHGLAVIERDSRQPWIRGLFEENLPMILSERLNILFKQKSKWTFEHIAPYVEVFASGNISVTSLLAKNLRSVVENGTRYYLAKHQ
jgi:sister chromatid cohesion protein DCC1